MLLIDGVSLTLEDLSPFLLADPPQVALTEEAMSEMKRSRAVVDEVLSQGKVVYGVNTGFGKLSHQTIDDRMLQLLQRNLVLSHAVGVGEPLSDDVVRIAMLLRANALSRGYSGIRVEVVNLLLACLNKGVLPVVPAQGSVGASGDLAPLSHMAIVLIGEGEATFEGEVLPGGDALKRAGLEPIVLEAKEGLALINGTQISTAIGAAALIRARRLMLLANLGCAMTLEALQGSVRPFDARVGEIRGHPGHLWVASHIRALLTGSDVVESHANCDRIQDQYSLRCVPQVHGAAHDAIEHVTDVVRREITAVTDNPLIFPEDGDIISAGNFHAEPVAMVFDYAAIAVAELASISERRLENLVNPDLSRLPAFLAPEPGINSGFMITQVTAAALVSENKGLCHPACVDSIPTSANKEDHVSMAPIAARQFAQVVENTSHVLAIEILAALQGLGLSTDLTPGVGVRAARDHLSPHIPPIVEDRFLKNDMQTVRHLMDDGSLLAAVQSAISDQA